MPKNNNSKIEIVDNNQRLGIDIGSGGIKVILLNTTTSEIKSFYQPTDSIVSGEIIDMALFEKDIYKIIETVANNNNDKIPKDIIVTTSSYKMSVFYDKREVFNLDKDGIISDNLIGRALKEILDSHNTIKNIVLDQKIYLCVIDGKEINIKDLEYTKGKKIKLYVLTICEDSKQYNAIYQAFSNLSIKYIEIIPGPYADAAASLEKKNRELGCVSINIGKDTTSLSVYENNILIYLKILNIGSEYINTNLIQKLKIDNKEAERLKIDSDFRNKSNKGLSVNNIINNCIEDIAKQISYQLDSIDRIGLLPGGAICCGGLSKDKRFLEYLRYHTKIPIYNIEQKNNFKNIKKIDPKYFRCLGATKFIQNIEENELFLRIIQNIIQNIIKYLKRYMP